MRQRLLIELTGKSRLALSNDGSLPISFVPGRAIRGACAELLLSSQVHDCQTINKECDFCALFLDEESAYFRNAYPVDGDKPVRPLPITFGRCLADPEHDPIDTLSRRIVDSLKGIHTDLSCRCGAPLEFVRSQDFITEEGHVVHSQVVHGSMSHAGIDRVTGTVATTHSTAVLQNSACGPGESSPAELKFQGSLDCPQHLSDAIVRLISSKLHHIGKGISRGYGQVQVEVRKNESDAGTRERVREWNKYLSTCLSECQTSNMVPLSEPWSTVAKQVAPDALTSGQQGFFVIDLRSDAILPEVIATSNQLITTGRYSHILDGAGLQLSTGCSAEVTLVSAFAQPTSVGGWSSAWSLPKPPQVVSAAGGVFVFWTNQLQQWMHALEQLPNTGVGQRLSEGFGEVEVCSPIHITRRNDDNY